LKIRLGDLPVTLDTGNLEPNVCPEMVDARSYLVDAAAENLRSGKCLGSGFLGWLNPGEILSSSERARLAACAQRLRDNSDVLLVIGIGGSYLGARAVIEALSDDPDRVVYAGHNVSAHYMTRLRKQLSGKRVAINVISKSGTTTEPAIAFRVMRDLVSEADQARLIVATTDVGEGALLKQARTAGYETFVVPEDIGGRFSVFSASGLIPIAYSGVDIDSLVSGAVRSAAACANPNLSENPAYHYGCARKLLYDQGFVIELLAAFEPRLHFVTKWWKQLFGESEGKDNCGVFPDSMDFSTDLHSLGQYIQQGRRMIFETFIAVEEAEVSLEIPGWEIDSDGMNYLAGKQVNYVNSKIYEAAAMAHREGGTPNMSICLEQLNAETLGALLYFFEIACGVGGLLMGVNPFDQPGVESYKKHMFRLLGKP